MESEPDYDALLARILDRLTFVLADAERHHIHARLDGTDDAETWWDLVIITRWSADMVRGSRRMLAAEPEDFRARDLAIALGGMLRLWDGS